MLRVRLQRARIPFLILSLLDAAFAHDHNTLFTNYVAHPRRRIGAHKQPRVQIIDQWIEGRRLGNRYLAIGVQRSREPNKRLHIAYA